MTCHDFRSAREFYTGSDNEYRRAGIELRRESGCIIRQWIYGAVSLNSQTQVLGLAYTRASDFGVLVPRPRDPVSFGIYAHEIGHQILHRTGRRPRWLEEIEAEEFALDQFHRFELAGVEEARARARMRLSFVVGSALQRCKKETVAVILDRLPEWMNRDARDWALDPLDPSLA